MHTQSAASASASGPWLEQKLLRGETDALAPTRLRRTQEQPPKKTARLGPQVAKPARQTSETEAPNPCPKNRPPFLCQPVSWSSCWARNPGTKRGPQNGAQSAIFLSTRVNKYSTSASAKWNPSAARAKQPWTKGESKCTLARKPRTKRECSETASTPGSHTGPETRPAAQSPNCRASLSQNQFCTHFPGSKQGPRQPGGGLKRLGAHM